MGFELAFKIYDLDDGLVVNNLAFKSSNSSFNLDYIYSFFSTYNCFIKRVKTSGLVVKGGDS